MDANSKAKKLQSYQIIIFSTLFIGYACYAYNRKSVAFAMPQLMDEGLTKNQAGECLMIELNILIVQIY